MSPEPHDRAELELVGLSADRTIFRRRRADGGFECVKRYEVGSESDARQEFAMARTAAGAGVIAVLDVAIDPESARPELCTEWIDGVDLDRHILESGALSSREAAAIGFELATIAARLHGESRLAHGDIKPANIMLTPTAAPGRFAVTLLDFEHARWLAEARSQSTVARFVGGTHGYTAPECYAGSAPDAAADVFSIGCVLAAMVCGTPPFHTLGEAALAQQLRTGLPARWRLDGCDPRWIILLEACLSPVPHARPSAWQLAEDLARLLATTDGEREARDRSRRLALGGALSEKQLASVHDQRARVRFVRRLRIHEAGRAPNFELPDEPFAAATALHRALRRLHAHRRILPCDDRLTKWRNDAVAALTTLLPTLPAAIGERRRAGDLVAAAALCDCALAVAQLAPRGMPTTESSRHGLLQRDPVTFFERQRRELNAALSSHRRVLLRIDHGIAAGNLAEIDGAIGEFSAMYGGSSAITATMRDRRHRLDFYLQRIGTLANATDAITALLHEIGARHDLSAAESLRDRNASGEQSPSPRALLRALTEIEDEFPAIAPHVTPARLAVHAALQTITASAWILIRDAERKLATPPIPIRPLAELMDRIDLLRESDVFVDGPDGTRSTLYDTIEIVRTRLDQARSERDRLTRGARDALDRGHITTAIFDMERAVDRFGDAQADPDDGLAAEYERARERKRELDRLQERNHELAARYGRLLSEPGATPHERLAVLRERETALAQLAEWLGPERGKPYAEDLVDVKREVLVETAQDGERRFLASRNDSDRRQVAQRTFDALLHALPDSAHEQPSHEARDILEVWSARLDSAGGAARRRLGDPQRKPRWPLTLVAVGGAIVAIVAAWWFLGRSERSAAEQLQDALAQPVPIRRSETGVQFDSARAIANLREFGNVLGELGNAEVAAAARRVAEAVDGIDAGRGQYPDVKAALAGFQDALPPELSANALVPVAEFTRRALRASIVIAVIREPTRALGEVLESDAALRSALSLADAEALEHALKR